jgi:hypothetical protein
MGRRDRPKPYEPVIRGPLRLDRRWSYEPPEPPVRTAAARWNELQALKAGRGGRGEPLE